LLLACLLACHLSVLLGLRLELLLGLQLLLGRLWFLFFWVSPLSGFLLRALQHRGLENSLLSSVYSIYLT
jgi:hypothetical protein